MNGYAPSKHYYTYEEKVNLLEDTRSLSDLESESGHADLESRFKLHRWASWSSWSSLAAAPPLRCAPWRTVVRFLVFLVPSFLQGRHAREQIRPAKLAPTAYLDGMRGLAALFVFFCHYFYQAFVIAESYGCDETNYHILKLPFLRLWYQGPAAVCVFFVISGYALSYRPTKLIRSQSHADLATTMSSLIFRRGIRLYLPTAISTLMIIGLLRIGAYEWTREFANDRTYMKNVVEPHPNRMEDGYAQLQDWAWEMFRSFNIFTWDAGAARMSYDVHLWTIPVEFRCSLFLFLTILGTARLQTRWRFLTVAGCMWITYRYSRWELILFFCGMLLAEMDHIRGAHVSSPALPVKEEIAPAESITSRLKLKPAFWFLVSIGAMYLMCQPDSRGHMTPGWVYLTSLIPEWWSVEGYRYWQSIGAVIFVYAVGHSPCWQRFFNSGVVQYFGKISYAIYLMHGPAMHTMGYHFEKWAYGVTGVEGGQYNVGFLLGSLFVVPTVIWWADVFWRAVDIPTVKFAKWFENKLIVKS
ncbi:O-acetyltransferase PaAT-1 [Paramyrothecium foliicola]|nr:O-acetyltransferase PaAT-1 [Paramyrothecium foliicola]